LPSPTPLTPPGLVVKKVSFASPLIFDPDTNKLCVYPRSILTPSRFGVQPIPSTTQNHQIPPLSVSLPPLTLQPPPAQVRSVTDFKMSLLAFRDDRFVPLSSFYPQFQSCQSMQDVISLSCKFAPSTFDLSKASTAHLTNPLVLDSHLLHLHTQQVSTIGLRPFLLSAAQAVLPITLQPSVAVKEFSSVSTFQCLHEIALHGVVTSRHPTFQPNYGYNCPVYDPSIADPEIICNLLSKGHRNGRFLVLPMDLVHSCVDAENLEFNTSPIFLTNKREDPLGRLVVNYSFSGPNHPDKQSTLPDCFGRIVSPQLGYLCLLIENAHHLFPADIHHLQGIRRDIDGAFHRMRYSLLSTLLCATQVLINGVMFAVFSTVALMGDQDVNYCFHQVTTALSEKVSDFISTSTDSPLPLSGAYVDDIFAVGPPFLMSAVHNYIGQLVGDGRAPGLCSSSSAIKESKDIRGSVVELLGWLFDIPHKTVQPNYLTFSKLVYYFFVAIGPHPFTGQRVSVRLLMILGAHAMRAANILTPLLGNSRSFHHNIRGSCNPSSFVFLHTRTVADIYLWRALLSLSFTDARVLQTSTSAPLFRMKLFPDEPPLARGLRSAQHATIIGYSDACTGSSLPSSPSSLDNFPGIGGFIPGLAWFGARYSQLSLLQLSPTNCTETNINILELYALLSTATLAISQLQSMQSSTGCHIHIYCDNISAISKCRTHRSNHPVYTYLLHSLSLLQLRNRCTVGTSFVAGVDNPIADAASRTFLVPNAYLLFKKHLAHLPYMQLSPTCINTMQNQLLLLPGQESFQLQPQPIILVKTILPASLPPTN
jgi:hypothetical protein